VSNKRNKLTRFAKDSSRTKVGGQSVDRFLSHTDLVNQDSTSAKRPASIRGGGDRSRSLGDTKLVPHAIQFGKPSQSGSGSATGSSSAGEWTNLLKMTASGGIASALSGGLGGIGGIGSLISGIVHLFGGGSKNAPPSLVEFHIPDSQQQTASVSSKGSSPGLGMYRNAGQMETSGSAPNAEWIQEQSNQIAQAVKNALLNSSSLNDVIAEI
jgi:hypothetical protein